MRFYTKPHRYYCGIDLHEADVHLRAGRGGQVRVHRNGPATPKHFLKTIAAYREDLVVAVECLHLVLGRRPLRPGGDRLRPGYHGNRGGVAEQFRDPEARKSIETNTALLDEYDRLLSQLELHLTATAKVHDVNAFYRLRSVPGIGKILALMLLDEIHDIHRFPRVQDFVSYCRAARCRALDTARAGAHHRGGGSLVRHPPGDDRGGLC